MKKRQFALVAGAMWCLFAVVGTGYSQVRAELTPISSAPAASAPAFQAEAAGAPKMELSPTEFNFGAIWQGMPARGEFTIKNVGDAPLTVTATSSCGCTVATRPKSPLAPGETTTFTISYDTKRPSVANKSVFLNTNDPQQGRVEIKVRGTVKALLEATPGDVLSFAGLDTDSRETRTIRLENRYPEPVHLKLRPDQNFGAFEVELREIVSGQEYELVATTRPPLRKGANMAAVVVETGLKEVSELTYSLSAFVQPRVMVSPAFLTVMPQVDKPKDYTIAVQYRVTTPLQIKEVKPSIDSIKWELLPPNPPPPDSRLASHQIRVTLPAYEELPPDGAIIEILTDDPDPEFQKLTVQVMRHSPRKPRASVVPDKSSLAPAMPSDGPAAGPASRPSGGD